MSMSEARRRGRRRLLASASLVFALAVATFLATERKAGRMRSYSDLSAAVSGIASGWSFATGAKLDLRDGEAHDRESERTPDSAYGSESEGDEMIDDDESDADDYDDVFFDDMQEEDGSDYNGDESIATMIERSINSTDSAPVSPVCHPHFNLALPNNRWSNTTKFKRIYFYHARKAGGSTMHKYLSKVSSKYGILLHAVEWSAMEEPGTFQDDATFYVTHLRAPVDRSISHFKYQGRWSCPDLTGRARQNEFTPTEENAKKLETWNKTGGHAPISCREKKVKKGGKKRPFFHLGMCAVNCYTQWFSGLSCPQWDVPLTQQYRVARAKVLKFNLIVVIEKLSDPSYKRKVEEFFGVAGLDEKGTPYCERPSHKANTKFPLVVRNDTRERLEHLNVVDRKLFHELSDCLDGPAVNNLDFPKFDPNRFELHSYNKTEAEAALKRAKAQKNKEKAATRDQ
ncbi:hypothetical protein ACHAWF_001667 [Thalassiosira exigua]